MSELKGSRTEKNLLMAFAGESQASARYAFFASAAKKEGFVQIEAAFLETADQERVHAKRFFKHLEGGEVEITAVFPAGVIGTTAANLKAAAEGEHHEWESMYPRFAEIAEAEGFPAIAHLFKSVAVAEKNHQNRFRGFLKNLENGTVFKKDKKVVWRCRKCGYIHEGYEAPNVCPACAHPQAHFEILAENW